MMPVRKPAGLTSFVFLAVQTVVALSLAVQAGAQYHSPLVVPAADFQEGTGYSAYFLRDSGYITPLGDHPGAPDVVAPVSLPDGASIQSVFALVYDNDAGSDPTRDVLVRMWRIDQSSSLGTVQEMFSKSTTGASTEVQTLYEGSPAYPVVDSPDYGYFVSARMRPVSTGGHRVYGVVIYYDDAKFPEPQSATRSPRFGGTSPYMLPASAFHASDFATSVGFRRLDGFAQYAEWTTYDPPPGCLVAPVYLPHGATLTSMYASVEDFSPFNYTIFLRRKDILDASPPQVLAYASTSGSTPGMYSIDDTSIDHPVIDNLYHAYYVDLCFGGNGHRLWNVRLYYTLPTIPLIFRDGFESGSTAFWSDTMP